MPFDHAAVPIGAEARGLARDFCRRADRETAQTTIQNIMWPLHDRVARYPYRHPGIDLVRALEQRWRTRQPQAFRLSFASEWRGKYFSACEQAIYFSPCVVLEGWSSPDFGVGVFNTELHIRRSRSACFNYPKFIIDSHALARWYQRKGERSDAMLLRDIAIGAALDSTTITDVRNLVAPVNADGESWRGELVHNLAETPGTELVFFAKTFF